MTQSTTPPTLPRRPQIKPYYQHHNLLLQFILSELIAIHYETLHIQDLITKLDPSPNSNQIHTLIHHLTRIVGSAQGHMRLFSWSDDGFLTKLKNYSSLLYQSREDRIKEEPVLFQEANLAWLVSMQFLDTVRSLHRESFIDIDQLQIPLNKLLRSLSRLTRLIAKILTSCLEDENLIFFLLRHRKELDHLYQKNFVSTILNKNFPKNSTKLHQFLISRYTERGFTNLIPTIEEKLAEYSQL